MAVTSASTSMPPPTNNGASEHNQRPLRPSGRSPGRCRCAWRLALLITLIGVAGCLIIGSVTAAAPPHYNFTSARASGCSAP